MCDNSQRTHNHFKIAASTNASAPTCAFHESSLFIDDGDGDDEELMTLLDRHDANRLVREDKQGQRHILGTSEAKKVFLGDKAKAKAHLEEVRNIFEI